MYYRNQTVVCMFFIFNFFSSFAQKASDSNSYIHEVRLFFDQAFHPTHFLLGENMDTSTFLSIKEDLVKDTFCRKITYDHGISTVIDTLVFNKQDRFTIDSFFASYENFAWKDTKLFKDAKIVSRKTIDSIESHRMINEYLQEHYASSLYFISKPIFLRNNTICIFYDEQWGYFSLSNSFIIYKKINNKWEWYQILDMMET